MTSHCHDTCDVSDKRNRQQAPAGIHVRVPCLEHERVKLEFDSALDRQPGIFPQNGCDVFVATGVGSAGLLHSVLTATVDIISASCKVPR